MLAIKMATKVLNASPFKNITIGDKNISNSVSSCLPNVSWSNEEIILLSDKGLAYVTMINTWGLGQCVTTLGLIVNVLNVVTFVKQGVKDSVNISLLGLTISDLGSLLFHFLYNLCWTPPIMNLDLPFYPNQIMYFCVVTHIFFTRITTGTTAWIAFERCVCVVAPLKVKSIITPRRTVTFIAALYVIMAATIAPLFYTTRPTWKFDVGRNKSVLGVSKIPNRVILESVAFYINNILPTLFFILIVIFTTVLVKTLKKNSKWRQKTSLPNATGMSNRDTKVSQIVVIISVVFIFCYFPGAVIFIIVLIFPSLKYTGKQTNLVVGLFSILFHLEGINATVNFFIYLRMSSKFKVTLKEILCLYKAADNNEVVK